MWSTLYICSALTPGRQLDRWTSCFVCPVSHHKHHLFATALLTGVPPPIPYVGQVDPRTVIMIVTFVLTCCVCIGVMFLGWFRHLLPQLRVKLGKVGLGLLEVCVKLGKVGKGGQRCVYRKSWHLLWSMWTAVQIR